MTTNIEELGAATCFVLRYIEESMNYMDDDDHCIERIFLYLDDAMQYCFDRGLSIYKNDLKTIDHSIEFKPYTSPNGRYIRRYFLEEYDILY